MRVGPLPAVTTRLRARADRADARALMDAVNTHRVFDWLWTSGQLSAADIAGLPALGIDTVVNLALPDSSNALAGEAERVTREGLAYVQIPVEWAHPQLAELTAFFGVLKAFEGHPTWVHCALNMRVSAFVLLYRQLCLGHDEADARHPLRAVWTPNPVWQAFIDRALGLRDDPAYNWPRYARST